MRKSLLLPVLLLAVAGQSQASPVASTLTSNGGTVNAMNGAAVSNLIASTGGTIVPLILAGQLPDTPAARVDSNSPSSPFSGVVSINIRYNDPTSGAPLSFICSGSMVSATQVLSAAHCVDTNGHGKIINLATPGSDIRVVFNTPTGFSLISAVKAIIHPNYQGFNICPDASTGCVNDDISRSR